MTFTTALRTKELGILRASTAYVVRLIGKEFIQLIGIAIVITLPLAYFGAQR